MCVRKKKNFDGFDIVAAAVVISLIPCHAGGEAAENCMFLPSPFSGTENVCDKESEAEK
jgi:hypothetical protein